MIRNPFNLMDIYIETFFYNLIEWYNKIRVLVFYNPIKYLNLFEFFF